MLQGWTLLGIHCPRCKQPLVRNKQRKMYCAGCSMWVLTEEEARQVKQTPAPSEAGEEGHLAASPHPQTLQPQPSPSAPAAAAAEGVRSGGDPLADASAAIMEKLSQAAAHLRDLPPSDPVRCEAYVALIRSCGAALGELQELSAKHRRIN
uniref:Uncharacterized protein n=1 Tax=Tetraselmis chuii TaxID=63592 RepID=A0A7S1X7J6_9CHLO